MTGTWSNVAVRTWFASQRVHGLQQGSNATSVPTTFNPLNKRMAWSSEARDIASRWPASRCASAESSGRLRLTTSNHWGGCEIHERTAGGIKTVRYRVWKNIGCLNEYEVVQGVVSATIDCIYKPSCRGVSRSSSMSSTVYSSSTPWLFRKASTSMRVS